jgi:8-oxo-dGTP diphosphatase
VDTTGRILLREPTGHFDDYVWTFPKGRPEPGETPEQAALREVRQETGYEVQILCPIPGTFLGGATENHYFLMAAGRQTQTPDEETQALCWATFAEARELITLTQNQKGRVRDLAVLVAAQTELSQITRAGEHSNNPELSGGTCDA